MHVALQSTLVSDSATPQDLPFPLILKQKLTTGPHAAAWPRPLPTSMAKGEVPEPSTLGTPESRSPGSWGGGWILNRRWVGWGTHVR